MVAAAAGTGAVEAAIAATVIAETESVCPECLARIPAQRVAYGEEIRLNKHCPDHGDFSTVVWRGAPAIETWARPKLPSHPDKPFTPVGRGCPYDCGLCPDHRQHSCCVLLEVTYRCDLRCAVCFASAGGKVMPDPDMATIEMWYRRLLEAGGPYNIQLSGGEPCQRDDLPEIIALGRRLGFTFFQVNTNGLRLARDADYLQRLCDAGLTTVFLQFDGTHDEVHRALRGRALAAQKEAAIRRCAEHGVGVVLVPTLVPGINTDEIGAIIDYALRFAPAVRGVHFQPISYFGRYPEAPADAGRITIPEVISAIAAQTGGAIHAESFCPPGSENALCSFHANFVIMPDGRLTPLTSHSAGHSAAHSAGRSCCGTPPPAKQGAARAREYVALQWAAPPAAEPAAEPGAVPAAQACCSGGNDGQLDSISFEPNMGEWDTLLQRAKTHTFCISGMAFQDAWTLDLERLRDCCIHVVSREGKLIPFCAYNLSSSSGCTLYRPAAARGVPAQAAAAAAAAPVMAHA